MNREQVFEIVFERKRLAERQAYECYQRARADADFAEADRQVAELDILIAKAQVQGKDTASLIKKHGAALDRYKKALDKLAISQQQLEPQYHCKKCNDTGFSDDSYCSCISSLLSKAARNDAGISGLPHVKLSQFDAKIFPAGEQRNQITKIYNLLGEYCAKFPNARYQTLLLMGASGLGKTYAAAALADAIIDKGYFVRYFTAFAFNKRLLKAHTDFSENAEGLEDILGCDLLIVDDLGSEPIYKNVTVEYLLNVLSERQLSGKNTVFTTNLSLDALDNRYGMRTSSRLTDARSLCVEFLGKDLRNLSKRKDSQGQG